MSTRLVSEDRSRQLAIIVLSSTNVSFLYGFDIISILIKTENCKSMKFSG